MPLYSPIFRLHSALAVLALTIKIRLILGQVIKIDRFSRVVLWWAVVLRIATALGLLAGCLVLGAEQTAPQYSISSWGHKDGMMSTFVFSLAQTPDGFLWLGTEDGVVRFDGIEFTQGRSEVPNDPLPGQVHALQVSRQGELLLGTGTGLVGSIRNGGMEATQLDSAVMSIEDAADGTMWVATQQLLWHLVARTREPVEPPITLPGEWLSGPLRGDDGREWIATQAGLYSVDAGRMVRAAPGRAWLLLAQGHPAWLDGQGQVHPLGSRGKLGGSNALATYAASIRTVMEDSGGTLWVGTRDNGLLRVSTLNGHTSLQQYTRADGLSSNFIRSIFEDHEHNLWVATANGLNRLRINRVTTLTRKDGLISDSVTSLAVGRDGSVWLATADGLQRLFGNQSSTYRRGVRILSLLIDRDQQLWAGTSGGLLRWRNGREVPAGQNAKFTSVTALAQDDGGVLWFLDAQKGLFRETEGRAPLAVTNASLAGTTITDITSGPGNTMWFGLADGNVVEEHGGEFRSYSPTEGLSGGTIHDLTFGPDQKLWVATERGLCFQTGDRFVCRSKQSGLPGNRVLWVLPDSYGNLWLGYNIGVAKMNAEQLREWQGKQTAKPYLKFFDEEDGIANSPDRDGNSPAAFAQDGRLWLTTSQGVAVLDPEHVRTNFMPPPVHILGVEADGKQIDLSRPVRLHPLTRSIQFSFTGLNLTAPRKMSFRYRLEGFDPEWRDAGSSREAFYTNLPPGHYTLRVRASNNDGIWNNTGAALSFTLAPAYFQTLWFRILCAAAAVLAVVLAFRLRLRAAKRRIRLGFEERMEERTRIAQELHDHLIQEMVGISMQLEVADELTPGNLKAKSTLQRALALSRSAIASGRLTLQSLRQRPVTGAALMESLRRTAEAYPEQKRSKIEYRMEGEERLLQPEVAEELSELGQEALRNALKHAGNGSIQVRLRYGSSVFELLVRDDGAGIADHVLRDGVPGHYGLAGMRERAERMKGEFSILSVPGQGTTVHILVPSPHAYQDHDESGNRRRERQAETQEK